MVDISSLPVDPFALREYHKDIAKYLQDTLNGIQKLNTYPIFLPNIDAISHWLGELTHKTDIRFGVSNNESKFYYMQKQLIKQAPTIPIVRNGIFRIPAYDFRIEYLGYRSKSIGKMHGFTLYNVQKLKGYAFPKVNIFKALSLGGTLYGFKN